MRVTDTESITQFDQLNLTLANMDACFRLAG